MTGLADDSSSIDYNDNNPNAREVQLPTPSKKTKKKKRNQSRHDDDYDDDPNCCSNFSFTHCVAMIFCVGGGIMFATCVKLVFDLTMSMLLEVKLKVLYYLNGTI